MDSVRRVKSDTLMVHGVVRGEGVEQFMNGDKQESGKFQDLETDGLF